MSIVFATSRGIGLQETLDPEYKLTTHAIPGGKLSGLRRAAEASITPLYGPRRRRQHSYFICGIPDLTSLVKCHKEVYKECLFLGDPEAKLEKYKTDLIDCQKSIVNRGALPIFCTVPNMNLSIYNQHLLNKCKTKILKHSNEYQAMQENLTKTIESLNSYIFELNKEIGVSTPFIHCTISERRGKQGKRRYVYRWDRLEDGLHPPRGRGDPKLLLKKWGGIISNAERLNGSLEDSDTDEDIIVKRSWKYPSKQPRVV